MFGSTSPFGQSSNSPFGSQSVFGQSSNTSSNPFAPQPFGSTTPFGAQTGSSLFGGNSTGVFGQTQSSPFGASSPPAFGQQSSPFGASSTPAFGTPSTQTSPFGAASTTSTFGQNPAFGAFGSSPAQTSPFGGTSQPSQSAFGSNMFGSNSTPSFGASQPAFGTNTTASPFGSTNIAPFGSTPTTAFGTTINPGFGTNPGFGGQTTTAFGATSASPFGGASTPAFGAPAPSTPTFGSTPSPTFGSTGSAFGTATSSSMFGGGAFGATTSTPSFGQSTSTFGQTSSAFGQTSSGFGFPSSAPAFAQTSSTFGSTPFGGSSPFGQSSSFGVQTSTTPGNTAFGQSAFGGQRGGSRVTPYTGTSEPDGNGMAKLESISAMPAYKEKSHEEIRWEDYQLGDKGGASPVGSFGLSTVQTNPLNPTPAPSFSQPSSSPFSTSTSSIFAPKTPSFPTTGFGVTSSSQFNSPSPFSSSSTQTGLFTTASSASPFGQTSSPSLFSTPSPFAFSAPTTSSTPSFNFPNSSNSQPRFGQTSTTSFGQNLSPFGSGLLNNTSSWQSSPLGTTSIQPNITQPSSAFANFQTSQPQQSSPFGFNNTTFNQQPGNSSGFGLAPISGQSNFGQVSVGQGSAAVQQPVPVTNPFGTLPAMPQMSIGRGGAAPSIQYGISSMPVVDKPAPVRVSSILTPRHLPQRRIRLPARKYNRRNDNPKAFFSDDEETPTTPKGDVVFHPRENPRALVIHPREPLRASAEKATALKNTTSPVHENGKISGAALFGGISSENNDETPQENGTVKESSNHAKANQKPNGLHDDHTIQKGDSYTTLSGHRAGEAAIVYEHGADIEAQMPKLRRSDYYTEPRIQELAAKERAEPGFCCRVKDFVVGRHGFGSIKFLGETDVRCLDLEGLVQFNNKEVIVYPDENKKPPVGQGLNKPAEVTLLNIKCIERKTGLQYTEGPKVEKYKGMLKKKAEEQGAKFVSFDAKEEEWTFVVDHFSEYKLRDEDHWDVDADKDC